jgi:hypothetical protein
MDMGTRVTVWGPNLRDQSRGTFVVHRADCGDNRKLELRETEPPWHLDPETRAEVIRDIYPGDQFDSPWAMLVDDVYFAPCLDRFPMGEDPDDPSVAARTLGREHGLAAGSWVIDGNTSDETVASILQGIEDGDPVVLDTLPSAPLSGEWAGDPTPATILAELEAEDLEAEVQAELLTEYEDAFRSAVTDQVTADARARLGR